MARQAWLMSGGRNVGFSGAIRQRLVIPVAFVKMKFAAIYEIT
jgi:hypothetical protein